MQKYPCSMFELISAMHRAAKRLDFNLERKNTMTEAVLKTMAGLVLLAVVALGTGWVLAFGILPALPGLLGAIASSSSETFFALFITLLLAIVMPFAMMGLSAVLGPYAPSERKLEPYESGIRHPVGGARERFSIKFYLVAILFIVFDVEAVFLFPWAVNFRELGLYGLVEMFVFIGVLFAGFVYVINKGALKWD